MKDLEDVKKLLERIGRGVRNSSSSDSDKKYLQELIDLAVEKIDGVLDNESKTD
jgi:hypothetical protein